MRKTDPAGSAAWPWVLSKFIPLSTLSLERLMAVGSRATEHQRSYKAAPLRSKHGGDYGDAAHAAHTFFRSWELETGR